MADHPWFEGDGGDLDPPTPDAPIPEPPLSDLPICPHCLCVNFEGAQTCRECHGSLAEAFPDPSLELPSWPAAVAAPAPAASAAGSRRWKTATGVLGAWAVLATGLLAYQAMRRPAPQPPAPHTLPAAPARPAPITITPALAMAVRPQPAPAEIPPARPIAQARAAAATRPLADPLPRGEAIEDPVWRSYPGQADIMRLYPQRAVRQDLRGLTALECLVLPDGGLSDCVVADEKPAGFGFGRAALQLTPYFRLAGVAASGAPVAGRHVRVPVQWRLD
jgi:periplasmic protein TonB